MADVNKNRLQTVFALRDFQKRYFASMQENVTSGMPFGLCSVDEAEEIFTAFGFPVITLQWWSSQISAKKLSGQYFDYMAKRGYDMDHYYSLGLACTMVNDKETAPWGGLPRPTVIVGRTSPEQLQTIKELWAREYNCAYFSLEDCGEEIMPSPDKWWEKCRDNWDELIPKHVLDLRVEELRSLIRLVETETGVSFDPYKFRKVIELVNEQADYFRKTRDIIAHTSPCPVSLRDQLALIPMQWYRGTEEMRDMSKALYEEVKERVDNHIAVCEHEKIRLMWTTTGLWSNTKFYGAFEEKYGAVFVSSMYFSIAADSYARTVKDDPLRALASRQIILGINSIDWMVKEAKNHGCDAAIGLGSGKGKSAMAIAFEKADIPYLELHGDNVDARNWDEEEAEAIVSKFIEEQILSKPESERRNYKG
jgi:benzoyl-CoA reductase/2-hydroxyglutaryl-CoA dehydratase subunit BcrC/BadD/HgdB